MAGALLVYYYNACQSVLNGDVHNIDTLEWCFFWRCCIEYPLCVCIYRVSQGEGTKLRESVPYVKI